MNTGNTETDTYEGARTIENETHSTRTSDEVQGGDDGDILQNYNEVVQREYKGVVVGTKNMDDIEDMAIRDDDVFVVTFPRSGIKAKSISLNSSILNARRNVNKTKYICYPLKFCCLFFL